MASNLLDLEKVSVDNTSSFNKKLNELNAFYSNKADIEIAAINELNDLELSNQDKLLRKRIAIHKQLHELGYADDLKAHNKRIEQLKAEYEARKNSIKDENDDILKNIEKQINAEYAAKDEAQKAFEKEVEKREKKANKEKLKEIQKQADDISKSYGKFGAIGGRNFREAVEQLQQQALEEKGVELTKKQAQSAMVAANVATSIGTLASYADKLAGDMKSISGYKSAIDTRLQGWGGAQTPMGSYWDQISRDVTKGVGLSPFIKQSAVNENISKLVGQGIAFDVEQRAFLETISDKIANTFEATDGTLLRLVRIQQQDSTAARLGMESALTGFLNSMYETSEYMQNIADQVRGSLEEAEALMGTKSAAAFEYQVQKWLGSMYSVGMSQSAVQGIANVVGQVAAGDISSLNGSGSGNLVIMAANKAGMSIADILNGGLSGDTTNSLMQAMVDYLAGIYNETSDSLVVQQQYAKVFGVAASDLKAAANLSRSVATVAKANLTYENMYERLTAMADTMYKRTSTGDMLSNIFDNLNYTMAAGIANNPVLYALYSSASMLKDLTGGIDFSLPLVMGSGLAQTFNIADIMKVGALGGGILSGMGQLFASFSNGGGFSGSGMLRGFGINQGPNVVTRGTGSNVITRSGITTSESAIVGNASGEDIQSKAMTDTTDESNQKVQNAQDSSDQIELKDVNESIVSIYTLLESVTRGTAKISVTLGDEQVWTRPSTL